MPKPTQYQIAILAILVGGVIVAAVFLLTSGGGGDNDGDQATSRTPTATPVASGTPGDDPTATSTEATPAETATEPAAPAATTAPTVAPAPATATSPPPAATSTTSPSATPTPTATATSTPTPTATAVTGIWQGTWETKCGGGTVLIIGGCGEMNLVQTGNIVTGSYAAGEATINGIVTGNRLTGTWVWEGRSGSIDFWVDGSGDTWQGNFDRRIDWCGRRPGEAFPERCGVASWYGTWGTNCEPSDCGDLTIAQNGDEVTGSYAGGARSIVGTVDGTMLIGTYMPTNEAFILNMLSNANQFDGHYYVLISTNQWCGKRNGAVYPVPCLN